MRGPNRTDRMRKEKRDAALLRLQQQITKYAKDLPSFGPELSSAPIQKCIDAVVCHRFIKKFQFPTDSDPKARREQSILNMLESDVPGEIAWSSYTDWARLRLSYWFRKFKPTYRFKVPTGASARPFGTEHDIIAKLTEDENWEVSPELLPYAFDIVWRNHALKRLVRARFRARYDMRVMNPLFRMKHGFNGYRIFFEQFKALCTINAVSRVETVPKNNDVDRVITCEPLWDMICQLSFMADIRSHMRQVLGYDVNTRGDLHKTLLNGDIATLDLKNASDLVLKDLVAGLWPLHMWKWLSMLRPKIVEAFKGELYHTLEMFAPMGTGITFDVMTFTLLALLRFDKSATVFGDDIIVKRENAKEAILVLESVGLVVNTTKSFVDGPFKESCGGMYHADAGYIKSFDFIYPRTVCDIITIVNKLNVLLFEKQCSFELLGYLEECRDSLAGTLPRVVFADPGRVDISSECVFGLTSRTSERTNLEKAIGCMWQRDVTITRYMEQRAMASTIPVGKDLSWMSFLFRGDVTPVRKDIVIQHRQRCSWSGASCKDVTIVPFLV